MQWIGYWRHRVFTKLSINELRDVTTTKFVLNAVDDPCCMIHNLYEKSPYPHQEGKTFAQMIRETESGLVAVTYTTGSHCPFICTRNRWLPFVNDPLTGGWMLNSWADQVAIEFYRAALDVYGGRRFPCSFRSSLSLQHN